MGKGTWPNPWGSGVAASRPSAGDVAEDAYYLATDTGVLSQSDGVSTWTTLATIPTANPEFTTIELGHASDTTIARSSAGVLTVEGNRIFAVGGADVPIADGGTGASTATAAFDALSPMTTAGDLIIGGASGTRTRLAAGSTSGHVLTSNGSGVAPSWQAAAAGGSPLTVKDEGSNLDTAVTSIDFVGAGVVATNSSHAVTVTISGGGGGGVTGKVPVAVGSATQTSSSSTLAVTITAASSGNLLIACISGIGTTDVTSIASTNTTWTVLQSSTAGTSPKAEIWKGVVSGGSSGTTVTITFTGNNSDRAAVISEWNGITGTLDQSSQRAGITTSGSGFFMHSTPVILPTNANALVVAVAATTNGGQRYNAASQMVPFEPLMLNTGTLGGYLGAYYAFPGTVPIALAAVGPTAGNYSSAIVSIT